MRALFCVVAFSPALSLELFSVLVVLVSADFVENDVFETYC